MREREKTTIGVVGTDAESNLALFELLTGGSASREGWEYRTPFGGMVGCCRLRGGETVEVVTVPIVSGQLENIVSVAHSVDVVVFALPTEQVGNAQAVECLHVLSLLGMRNGLVVLTSKDLIAEACAGKLMESMRNLVMGTFLEGAPICIVSTISNQGNDDFFRRLEMVIGNGVGRPVNSPFRMWVLEEYSLPAGWTRVVGVPTHGSIRSGDNVRAMPGSYEARIVGLQVYGKDAERGCAGEWVALNLIGLSGKPVKGGTVICAPEIASLYEWAEAELTLLPSVGEVLRDGAEVELCIGTARIPARVYLMEGDELKAGQFGFAHIHFSDPMPVVPGERFLIRAGYYKGAGNCFTVVGGGCILGVSEDRIREPKTRIMALVERRAMLENVSGWCETILKEYPHGIDASRLIKEVLLVPSELDRLLGRLERSGIVYRTGKGKWIHSSHIRQISDSLYSSIEEYLEENPHRAGISMQDLCAIIDGEVDLVELGLKILMEDGLVIKRNDLYAPYGWVAVITGEIDQMADIVEALVEKFAFNVPTLDELLEEVDCPRELLKRTIEVLCDRRRVVCLPGGRFLHVGFLEKAKNAALSLFRHSIVFSTSDFQDAIGVSRKYAIPILDYLDQIGFTVRDGNRRTPGPSAERLLRDW